MALEATVSAGWVNTVISATQRLGVAPDVLLKAAGITAPAPQSERWPIDHITQLWHAAERCTGDTALGLKTGRSVSPASLSVVGFTLQSAATLRHAFATVQRFQSLISDGGRFQLLASQPATWIVYHPRQGQLVFSPHQVEAVLAATITLARWLLGEQTHPLRVQFSQAQLAPLKDYQETFQCNVEFDQAFNGILLDNTLLDHPLPQVDPHLAQLHARYTEAHLAALEVQNFSVEKLRQWIHQQMGNTLPRRAQAAARLGISERTLARRLRAQHTSYEALVDEVRREKALEAVQFSTHSLSDIAQTLGFAEASTFYRAFRRWTGMPPAQWRKHHARGPL